MNNVTEHASRSGSTGTQDDDGWTDTRPQTCRFRLQDEGKPYGRSSCGACARTIVSGLGNACALGERTKSMPATPSVASIVPVGCTGSAFSFDPGVLYVNKDGSGYIAIDEEHFTLKDDRDHNFEDPSGSVHWITRFPAGEMAALRDFLNGIPFTPSPDRELLDMAVEALEKIAVGDVPRPVAKPFRADGEPSKYDRCEHDMQMKEECGNCAVAFARSTLATIKQKMEGK